MSPREQFDRDLNDLRSQVLKLGTLVSKQFDLALQVLDTLDPVLAKQIIAGDQEINETRFAIEAFCFTLVATQQPAARDLRAIFAAMNMIVDFERMGDKVKDIAETIPHILKAPDQPRPGKLTRMANLVKTMLDQCILAYANSDIELAKDLAIQDEKLAALFSDVLERVIEDLAKATKEKKVTASFGILRTAQHLERIGDLATNVAERILYIPTGDMQDMKAHQQDTID
ncbi:MAG TPA: phosphate signaling complex protein PhoU [Aggregatilineaceae bacterium]|nr:phosphate signaling complex protein PhoU [Aggregatilineaceae bacterium]